MISVLRVCEGWVQVFFPYILEAHEERGGWGCGSFDEAANGKPKKSLTKNTSITAFMQSAASKTNAQNFKGGFERNECGSGVKLERIPPGMSNAPFR